MYALGAAAAHASALRLLKTFFVLRHEIDMGKCGLLTWLPSSCIHLDPDSPSFDMYHRAVTFLWASAFKILALTLSPRRRPTNTTIVMLGTIGFSMHDSHI